MIIKSLCETGPHIDHEINQFHEDLLKFVACRNSFDKKLTYKKLQSQILKKLNAQKKV